MPSETVKRTVTLLSPIIYLETCVIKGTVISGRKLKLLLILVVNLNYLVGLIMLMDSNYMDSNYNMYVFLLVCLK